jgi:Domain of unknown function (DUF4258)
VSEILRLVRDHVANGRIRLSQHGFRKLQERGIEYDEILAGLARAQAIESYPDYVHGPSVLALQTDFQGEPIHVIWGLPKQGSQFAAIVTAYKPDPKLWETGMKRRKAK